MKLEVVEKIKKYVCVSSANIEHQVVRHKYFLPITICRTKFIVTIVNHCKLIEQSRSLGGKHINREETEGKLFIKKTKVKKTAVHLRGESQVKDSRLKKLRV